MNSFLLVAVLVVAPSAFGLPTQPGSAGHHGAVQSGQLLANRDQSQFTPYSSEHLQQQQQQQQWTGQPIVPQERAEGQLCAGCLPSSQIQQGQSAQQGMVPLGVNRNYNDGAGFAYSVQLDPQQQMMHVQMQQQMQRQQWGNEQLPQQREGALCAGCLPSNWQQGQGSQVQQAGQVGGANYGYSVQLTQPPANFNLQQKQQWGQQQQPQFRQDPAAVQHLEINDNGQYSFSYNAADSSRQEQRNLDGTVTGNYGYTDPTGRQVQVEYRAGPHEGYHAFGDNIPPQNLQSQQLPVPVQDTPEVQAARAQFFEAYNQQLKRIQQEQEAAAKNLQQQQNVDGSQKVISVYSETSQTEGQSVGATDEESDKVKGSLDFKNLPEPIAVPDSNTLSHSELEEDDELDNDAVVINSDDAGPPAPVTDTDNQQPQQGDQVAKAVGVGQGSLYQISHVVGADGQAQTQQIQGQIAPVGLRGGEGIGTQPQQLVGQQGQSGDNMRSGLPGYFYYVSVGGTPHYVTSSNLLRSDFPTSVKATLVGALPIAAVHDTQVPQSGGSQGQAQVKSSQSQQPLYLDFDNKVQTGLNLNNVNIQQQSSQQQSQNPFVYGFIPGTFVSFRNDPAQTQGMNHEVPKGQTLGQIPVVGYPILYFRK